MNSYMSEEEFKRKCEAEGLKRQSDGSYARDGGYSERVNYDTNKGTVSNGNGSNKRAFESTLNDSIDKASGK